MKDGGRSKLGTLCPGPWCLHRAHRRGVTGSKFPDNRDPSGQRWRWPCAPPPVHNTQPWRWRVGSTRLHLICRTHPPTAQHRSRPAEDLMLSCGASRYITARLALAAVGLASPGYTDSPTRQTPITLRHWGCTPRSPRIPTSRFLRPPFPGGARIGGHYSSAAVSPADIRPDGCSSPLALRCDDAAWVDFAGHAGISVVASVGVVACHRLLELPARIDGVEKLDATAHWRALLRAARRRRIPPPRCRAGSCRYGAGPASGATGADDHAVIVAPGTRDDDALARLRAGEAASAVPAHRGGAQLARLSDRLEPLEVAETRAALRSEIFEMSVAFPPDVVAHRLGARQRPRAAADPWPPCSE